MAFQKVKKIITTQNDKNISVETTPACKKNSGIVKSTNPVKSVNFLSFANLEMTITQIADIIKYGNLTANSLTPKVLILKADNQVDKGGFAQNGTP